MYAETIERQMYIYNVADTNCITSKRPLSLFVTHLSVSLSVTYLSVRLTVKHLRVTPSVLHLSQSVRHTFESQFIRGIL